MWTGGRPADPWLGLSLGEGGKREKGREVANEVSGVWRERRIPAESAGAPFSIAILRNQVAPRLAFVPMPCFCAAASFGNEGGRAPP